MSQKSGRLDRIYSYIKERIETGQGSPSQREIAMHCELSPTSVSNYLGMLEAQGRISRQALKSRSIRIIDQDPDSQGNEIADEVYGYLKDEIGQGNVPTQREVAEACYISQTEVRRALLWLEAQGRIERVSGQRNIRLLDG